ncbi:hypothetical protein ACET3Z_026915 [Daucus carota]
MESPSPTLTVNAGNSGSPAAGQITPANSGGDLVSGSTSHPSLPKNSVIIDLTMREVGPEMKSQSCGSNAGAVCLGDKGKSVNDGEENDDGDFKDVKIFGVMLEQEKKKRARDEIFDSRGGGSGNKERKMGEAEAAEGIKVGTS